MFRFERKSFEFNFSVRIFVKMKYHKKDIKYVNLNFD